MAKNEINNEIAINSDNAILLLAAAQELDLPVEVVETTSDGVFRVPQEVVDKAGLGGKKAPSQAKVDKATDAVRDPGQQVVEDPAHPEPKAPEKRAARKRAPAKQAATKKAAAPEQKSE
jgi:hypothetical protein